MHGRYAHTNSAFREKIPDQPLINPWMEEFKKHCRNITPELRFQASSNSAMILIFYLTRIKAGTGQ